MNSEVAAETSPEITSSEELAGRLRQCINRLHRQLRQESLAGLSPAQASALASVCLLGNPTLGELATREQVQPPTMTRIVGSLTEAGQVTRVTDPSDRRSARVQATPAGLRTMERIRTLKTAFLLRRLSELDPAEQAAAEQLVNLLEHLVEP